MNGAGQPLDVSDYPIVAPDPLKTAVRLLEHDGIVFTREDVTLLHTAASNMNSLASISAEKRTVKRLNDNSIKVRRLAARIEALIAK